MWSKRYLPGVVPNVTLKVFVRVTLGNLVRLEELSADEPIGPLGGNSIDFSNSLLAKSGVNY